MVDYITVGDTGPTADFSAVPLSGDEPLTVVFTDLSTSYDGIASWLWDFGDGQTSTDQNPAHEYAQDGTYTVSLTVSEADGDTDTETKADYITVSDTGPAADFSAEPLAGDEPLTVAFTDLSTSYDGIVSWLWDFGDGQTSTEQDPSHEYAHDGTYTVSLTVTEADGDVSTETLSGFINVFDTEPVADIGLGVMPFAGDEPLALALADLSTSHDGIVSWLWDFGDGGTSTGQNPTHEYTHDGTYTVSLTVTGADKDSDTETRTACIIISDTGPTADFLATPLSGDEPLTCAFTDLSTSYDGIISWLWDFGDGQTSAEQSPTHEYAQDGTYTVTLTVTEVDGSMETTTKTAYITVSDTGPTADFSATPLSVDERLTIVLADLSSSCDGITSWLWDFGDGSTSIEQNPTHEYAQDGTYTVTLTVNEADGDCCTTTKTCSVTTWSHIFDDPRRNTTLYINVSDKAFRFTAPDGFDTGTVYAPRMVTVDLDRATGVTLILVSYRSRDFSLFALAIGGRADICLARAWRFGHWREYALYDPPGVEGQPGIVKSPTSMQTHPTRALSDRFSNSYKIGIRSYLGQSFAEVPRQPTC
ncbi:PKD domain-containing protein [Chloroflexota bacterium]